MLSCPLFLRMFYGVMNQEMRHRRLGRNLPTLTAVSPGTPSIVLLSLGRACLLHPPPQMRGIRSCPTMAEQAVISHLAGTEEPKTCNWVNLGHKHTVLLLVQTTSFFWYYLQEWNGIFWAHTTECNEVQSQSKSNRIRISMTRNSQLKTQQ